MTRRGETKACKEIEDVELAIGLNIPYVSGGLLDQPTWFIETYKIKRLVEAEHAKKQARLRNGSK